MNEFNKQVFEQAAKWECAGGCGRPATQVIEWRRQDGDRERRILCQEHALEDQKYWSAMDWETGVEVSNIDEWALSVCDGGKTATRFGSGFSRSGRL